MEDPNMIRDGVAAQSTPKRVTLVRENNEISSPAVTIEFPTPENSPTTKKISRSSSHIFSPVTFEDEEPRILPSLLSPLYKPRTTRQTPEIEIPEDFEEYYFGLDLIEGITSELVGELPTATGTPKTAVNSSSHKYSQGDSIADSEMVSKIEPRNIQTPEPTQPATAESSPSTGPDCASTPRSRFEDRFEARHNPIRTQRRRNIHSPYPTDTSTQHLAMGGAMSTGIDQTPERKQTSGGSNSPTSDASASDSSLYQLEFPPIRSIYDDDDIPYAPDGQPGCRADYVRVDPPTPQNELERVGQAIWRYKESRILEARARARQLAAVPTDTAVSTPERRGLIDAPDSGLRRVNEMHPALLAASEPIFPTPKSKSGIPVPISKFGLPRQSPRDAAHTFLTGPELSMASHGSSSSVTTPTKAPRPNPRRFELVDKPNQGRVLRNKALPPTPADLQKEKVGITGPRVRFARDADEMLGSHPPSPRGSLPKSSGGPRKPSSMVKQAATTKDSEPHKLGIRRKVSAMFSSRGTLPPVDEDPAVMARAGTATIDEGTPSTSQSSAGPLEVSSEVSGATLERDVEELEELAARLGEGEGAALYRETLRVFMEEWEKYEGLRKEVERLEREKEGLVKEARRVADNPLRRMVLRDLKRVVEE